MFRRLAALLGSTANTIYCMNCGAPNQSGSTYCTGCGKLLAGGY